MYVSMYGDTGGFIHEWLCIRMGTGVNEYGCIWVYMNTYISNKYSKTSNRGYLLKDSSVISKINRAKHQIESKQNLIQINLNKVYGSHNFGIWNINRSR